jgi:hypothetical protein
MSHVPRLLTRRHPRVRSAWETGETTLHSVDAEPRSLADVHKPIVQGMTGCPSVPDAALIHERRVARAPPAWRRPAPGHLCLPTMSTTSRPRPSALLRVRLVDLLSPLMLARTQTRPGTVLRLPRLAGSVPGTRRPPRDRLMIALLDVVAEGSEPIRGDAAVPVRSEEAEVRTAAQGTVYHDRACVLHCIRAKLLVEDAPAPRPTGRAL